MKQGWVLAVALSASCGCVAAQTTVVGSVPPPAPPPVVAPAQTQVQPLTAPSGVLLVADSPVRIALAEAVSSKDRKRGDTFAISLASPIVVGGQILAPAGTTGMGEVVYAEAGGGGGSPGKLVLAARYIDVGSVRVHLKAFNLSACGDSEFREMQMAAELIGPAVFLINGHDVVYPLGTRARAKVALDVTLPAGPPADATTAAAQPTTTPAPAPVATPTPTASPTTTSTQETAK